MTATDHVLVFDEDRDRAQLIVRFLQMPPLKIDPTKVLVFGDLRGDSGQGSGQKVLRSGLPSVAIVIDNDRSREGFSELSELAREQGVTTLLVVEHANDPESLVDKVKDFDDWISLESLERDLAGRVSVILDRSRRRARMIGHFPAIDPRFLALVVHDLRTPLNVIGLTIRAITQTVPDRSAELDEDLTFLKENAGQIEKMLAQLGDYCRLIEADSQVSPVEFDPRRFLADFLEVHRMRPAAESFPVTLELDASGPMEVSLDQNRVKLAIQHSLANALNAAGKTAVRIRSSGGPDRWVLEFIVDRPPPQTVVSRTLRADLFERLSGSAAERRGLDLAIVAHISELFGGTARLVVDPERCSTIVLDWPSRQAVDKP